MGAVALPIVNAGGRPPTQRLEGQPTIPMTRLPKAYLAGEPEGILGAG